MGKLVLVRHGQSQWNLANKFTGWVDVDLSEQGQTEAKQAGELIKKLNQVWHVAHTSRLKRAQNTLKTALAIMGQQPPVWIDSALNERHYGDLQGLNKDEVRQNYGEEQVHQWRRSFDVPPPNGECLADTAKRTLPYFKEYILPHAQRDENVLIFAHGNSLRSIIMALENMTPEQILQFEIATGVPYLYDINSNGQAGTRQILGVSEL